MAEQSSSPLEPDQPDRIEWHDNGSLPDATNGTDDYREGVATHSVAEMATTEAERKIDVARARDIYTKVWAARREGRLTGPSDREAVFGGMGLDDAEAAEELYRVIDQVTPIARKARESNSKDLPLAEQLTEVAPIEPPVGARLKPFIAAMSTASKAWGVDLVVDLSAFDYQTPADEADAHPERNWLTFTPGTDPDQVVTAWNERHSS